MSDGQPRPPTESTAGRSPQSGSKDTDDLSDIQGVQRPGMQEKGQQVDQTPGDVTGEHDAIQPQNQRR